jgi:hypothetical protein
MSKKDTKSKSKGSKQKTEQITDPIEIAKQKPDSKFRSGDAVAFLQTIIKQDSGFATAVREAKASYKECYDTETKYMVSMSDAKQLQEKVKHSRSQVAESLRPIIPKILSYLGDKATFGKVSMNVTVILRAKAADSKEDSGAPQVNNIKPILQNYEEKYGAIIEKEDQPDSPAHERTTTQYNDVLLTDIDAITTMIADCQAALENDNLYGIKWEIDNHWSLQGVKTILKTDVKK